jgi:flagellar FliL protein
MKKNLISIGIFALLIVNTVLTAILMFSVVSTNKKTAALVGDIATAINLELVDGSSAPGEEEHQISISDIDSQTIPDLTIPLKAGADGKTHVGIVSVTFSLDKTHPDYKTYGEGFQTNADLIKGEIINVVSGYTYEESSNTQAMCDGILAKVQALYGSDFITRVTFSNALFQ